MLFSHYWQYTTSIPTKYPFEMRVETLDPPAAGCCSFGWREGFKLLCLSFGLMCVLGFIVYVFPALFWKGTLMEEDVAYQLRNPDSTGGLLAAVYRSGSSANKSEYNLQAEVESTTSQQRISDAPINTPNQVEEMTQSKYSSNRQDGLVMSGEMEPDRENEGLTRQRRAASEPRLEPKTSTSCLPSQSAGEAKVLDKSTGEYVQRAKIIFGEQGQDIKLVCSICRPEGEKLRKFMDDGDDDREEDAGRKTVWLKQEFPEDGEEPGEFEEVEIEEDDDGGLALSLEGDLLLENVDPDTAGFYKCLVQNRTAAIYRLDVVEREVRMQVVPRQGNYSGLHPREDQVFKDRNLLVYTSWGEWTPCSSCDDVGYHRRPGLCMVKKLDRKQPVKPTDVPLLTYFTHGVPCRSTALPTDFRKTPEVAGRHSELLQEYCTADCPTLPPTRTITDADGEVIEVVKTGEGYLSMNDGLPTFPPLVKRRTLYQDVGKPLIITCPSMDNAVGIRWQNKTKRMDPISLSSDVNNRVKIDVLDRIFIDRTEFTDTGHYNCWLKGRHVATVSVRIVESFETKSWKEKIVVVGVYGTMIAIAVGSLKMYIAQRKNSKAFQ